MDTQIHHGHNVKRLRQILGVTEEKFAKELGQNIPELEAMQVIDDSLLEKISRELHVPVDRIKYYNDDSVVQYITNNTFEKNEKINIGVVEDFDKNNCYYPLEKMSNMYERWMKEKNERIAELEQLVAKQGRHPAE